MDEVVVDPEQQRIFYGVVREFIIGLILSLSFYTLSYSIVSFFRGSLDKDDPIIREEDGRSYKITTVLCSVAVTISLGAMVLLPSSIISNEIIHFFPDAYYINWLNTSLITDLWNLIFLGSNLCLFFLLPFAFFFYEAEGIPWTKKGVMSRVYEAFIILLLTGMLVIGIVWVADSMIRTSSSDNALVDINGLFSSVSFLYSCMSMLGVLLSSLCTPIGFAHVFTVLGQVIVQPELHVDVTQELETLEMELAALKRRKVQGKDSFGFKPLIETSREVPVEGIHKEINRLERHQRSSKCERHFLFPLSFLFLLSLTCVSLLLVSVNIFSLVFSSNYLPKGAQDHIYSLGEISSSFMGPIGALVEVILIIYMMTASLVGFYSAPLIKRFLPVPHKTSMLKMILNSIILLALSSAMPVMVRALGITKFNLMGHFSSIAILQSFWVVLSYNVTFFVLTCSIIFKRATQRIIKDVTYLLRSRMRSINLSSFHNFKGKQHID